jgi:hypothetical protein
MNAFYLLYFLAMPLAVLAPVVLLVAMVALISERLREAGSRVMLTGAIASAVVGCLVSIPIYVLSGFRRLPVDVVLLAGGAAFTVASVVQVVRLKRRHRRLQSAQGTDRPFE